MQHALNISHELLNTDVAIVMDGMQYDPLSPTSISVGTMTVNVKIKAGPTPVPIGGKRDFMDSFNNDPYKILTAMNGACEAYDFVDKTHQNMKNGVIFHSTNTQRGSHKVIKIFRNGNAQFNGVKSTDDLEAVCNALLASVEEAFGVKGIQYEQPTIQMMTCTFSTGTPLKLAELAEVIRASGQEVRYNREIHHGVLYKIDGATVIAFSTGRVLLLGCKEFSKVRDGFNSLMRFVFANYDKVHLPPELVVRAHKRQRRTVQDEMDILSDLLA